MKQFITIMFVCISMISFGKGITYTNNSGANIIGGQVGSFKKSSFSWTVSQNGNIYEISTNAVSKSFNVSYSHKDEANNLFVYKVKGSGLFDGSHVKLVMTNGKLSDYGKGDLAGGNILTILFTDNSGYIYKLNK